MTIEVSAAIVISIVSAAFSIYFGFRNSKRTDTKDIEERIRENTKIDMKLDAILNTTNEMKSERVQMKKELSDHDVRLVKVEESTKQAHHRIDEITDRLH